MDGETTWTPPSAEEVFGSMDGYVGVFKGVTVFDASYCPEQPLIEVSYPGIVGAETKSQNVPVESFNARDGGLEAKLSNGVILWRADGDRAWQVIA